MLILQLDSFVETLPFNLNRWSIIISTGWTFNTTVVRWAQDRIPRTPGRLSWIWMGLG